MKSQFFSYRIFHYGAIWGVAGLWGVDPAPIPRENTPLTMGGTLILSPPWGSGGGGGQSTETVKVTSCNASRILSLMS